MSQENVEIVRALLDAWDRGDYAAGLASIDREIETVSALQMDNDATYRGHVGLAEMLGAFWAEFDGARMEIEEAKGNRFAGWCSAPSRRLSKP